MTPKIEWCNWVFDYMDTNKWMVKCDCCRHYCSRILRYAKGATEEN